jgi:hypothetical protein
MPNGEPLTDAVVQLHFDAAEMLEESWSDLVTTNEESDA